MAAELIMFLGNARFIIFFGCYGHVINMLLHTWGNMLVPLSIMALRYYPSIHFWNISMTWKHPTVISSKLKPKWWLLNQGNSLSRFYFNTNNFPRVKILKVFLYLLLCLQASGLVMLIIGVWMILQLHKYVETDSRVSTALPLTFLGLAATIMLLASLACCCTAKGKVPLLYLVRFFDREFNGRLTKKVS